jgi:hypothetical protein
MKIHGVRIYPQSVRKNVDSSTPIYVHDSVSSSCSDFFYTFRPIASLWKDCFLAMDFPIGYNDRGELEDPIPSLRQRFGSSLVTVDARSGLALLRGGGFEEWGSSLHFYESAFLPIFDRIPAFELLNHLYWSRDYRLTSENWPNDLRAVLHMWDDVYWQLFTPAQPSVEKLIQTHFKDPKLKMYSVDFDQEFPDPSNQELQIASPSSREE